MMADHHPNQMKSDRLQPASTCQASREGAEFPSGKETGLLDGWCPRWSMCSRRRDTHPRVGRYRGCAGIGIILILIETAISFLSSVSNSRKKFGLVEEIEAQIKQEREFYRQLYDKLEELDKLLAENENECHIMAEIIMKWGLFGLTASAAIQPVKNLLEAYEDMKKIGKLISKSMIPTVRHDLSMNDDRRKIAGGMTILAGVAKMGIEFYNFVDGHKYCARNGEVEKIRELANLLV